MHVNFNQPQEPEPEPLRVRVPFLNQSVGLGDAIKAATETVGIQPCGGCKKRQELLNRRIVFNPWAT